MSFFVCCGVLLGQGERANAATANTLNFQGRLLSSSGSLVPDGSYNIEFNLYTVDTGGSSIWTENRTGGSAVDVQNGYFSVYLGDVTAFGASIPWDQELWLTMNVNGDGEMNPRFKLTATPYAFRAGAVTDAAGNAFTGDDLVQISPTTSQALTIALAAIRLNQTGTGGLLELQGDGSTVFSVDKAGETVIGAGLTLGDSSSVTAGTIRWDGTDFEGFDGSSWVSLTQGSGGVGGTITSSTATFYDSAGGTTIASGSFATINLDATLSNSDASVIDVASDVVTVTEDGFYEISYQVTSRLNSGTRSGFNAKIQRDTGGGFIDVAGSQSFHYGRVISETQGTSSATVTLELNAGDSLRLVGAGTSQSFVTIANATSMTVTLLGDGGGGGTTAFQQNGNAFGVNGVLGTTDANGLDIITDGNIALSIDAAGAATLNNGLSISSGNLDLASGNITQSGDITGAGALTLASGGAADLTLDSASNVLVLADDTLRRSGTGTTTLDLLDASGATSLNIANSDAGQVANLNVEGAISGLSFSGNGAGLTSLDASALSTGVVADGRLSSNVALLNGVQVFSGTNTFNNNATFSSGLTLGNSALANAGNLRWTGTDFEGFDGTSWVSLTSGGGGGGAGANVIKSIDESISTAVTLQDDDELLFPVGANQTWTFDFVVQASSGTTPDIQFAVTAPVGSTCAYGYEDSEGSASGAQFTCGTSTGRIETTGTAETYRISGTVTTGVTTGDVQLQWSQATSNAAATSVLAGSYVVANEENGGSGGLGGGGGGTSFDQGGNGFGATGLLGTTDSFGLNIITNGTNALTFDASGSATFTNALTVDGGVNIDGDIAATNGLTISSGTFADLTLSSASGTLLLDASLLQRAGSGTTGLDLLDAGGNTTFSIYNSDPSNVANLIVEGSLTVGDIISSGAISATSFSGNGAGLIGVNASNISSGTLADGLLSSNVALLDTAQAYSQLQTFNSGLVVGNSVSASAGAIRWTGTDFEGFDGTSWVSLTTSSSAPLLEGVVAFGKYDGVVGSALNEEGATVTKNGTGDYTVTFDSATMTANYTIQLTVDEPVATLDDVIITADSVSTAGFDVDVHEGDNGGTAGVRRDRVWNFIIFDADAVVGGGGGGLTGNEFVNGGNAFGGTAQLGTTDPNGLRLFTNNNIVLDIDAAGASTFTGALDTDGLLTANNGLTVATGSLDVSTNGITNAGAIAGVTTIDASGTATVGGLTTTGTVDATTVIVDFLTANNAISAPTTGDTINGLVINAGALDGVSGYNQTSGNFTLNGTGTFTTGTGDVTFNGDVTANTTLGVNDGLTVNGSDVGSTSRIFARDSISVGTGILTGPGVTNTFTFDADNDADESAWTFVSDNGGNGLNSANTARAWSHDTNETTSANVGPTSGQGGSPEDGYVYTEASAPAALNDTFTMTYNTILDAATANWVVEFYWNQRGDDNTAVLDLQTNEASAGWVTRASFGGGDQPTGATQVWNFESIDLTGVVSDASTEVRFLVTFPAAGTSWNNDFGLDTITVREDTATSSFTYSDNLIEGYNASATSDVDLLSLRSDVGEVENVVFRVDSDGDIFSDGVSNIAGGADIAENYLNTDGAEPGDVVYFTDNRTVAKTTNQYQAGLAGVVSTQAAIVLDAGVDGVPVGLKGRLPTKISVANGEIKRGDYLTSGPNGVAVKATGSGTAIGIAMEDATDDGVIDVFVGLTYYVAEAGYSFSAEGLELPQTFNDIDVETVATDGIIRLTRDGELVNINGITLLAGGIDNNFSGIRSVGNVLGAWTVEARDVQLTAEEAQQNVLAVTYDENEVFSLAGDGSLGLRVASERAFSIQNRNGLDLFSVNTEGGVVQIGGPTSDPSAVLFVLARTNTPEDPIGVNGAQYYNEYLQKFRCHQNSEWVDCVTSVVSEYVIAATIEDWALTEDTTELLGLPRTWLDLRSSQEQRLLISVSSPAAIGAACSLEYQIGSSEWQGIDESVVIDQIGTVKTEWLSLPEDVRAAEETQLRVMCVGGDGAGEVSLSAVRIQVR